MQIETPTLREVLTQEIRQGENEQERRACERSLLDYTHAGWRWAGEPGRFVDNWHIECMFEHLEAVANRQILRLLINVPLLKIQFGAIGAGTSSTVPPRPSYAARRS
jgi:hypothetical protein